MDILKGIKDEIRKAEIRLIVTEKLKTTEDVKSYITQTEEDIGDVTNLRQKYRNKLRNCTGYKINTRIQRKAK